MMVWSVRHGLPDDLDRIVAIERQTLEAPHWPQSIYNDLLCRVEGEPLLRRQIFVASTEDHVLGFSVGSLQGGTGGGAQMYGELETVAVASEFRRLGLGRALCRAILDWCRGDGATEVALEVRSRSLGPIALYRGLGFEVIGRRPRYYRDPEDDALLMRLRLGRPGT